MTPDPARVADRGQRPLRPYDFRRPDRLSKEQLSVIEGLFNAFGRFLGPHLGVLLRAPVQVRVESVEQHVWEELVTRLPLAGCVALYAVPQLGGRLVALVDAADAAFLTDILLGGDGGGESDLGARLLGETDRLVLERLFALWPDHLRTAWRAAVELDARLAAIEGSLEFLQLASPQETVVVVRLGIDGAGRPVTVSVLLLHTGLQPVLARLRPGAGARAREEEAVAQRARVREAVLDAPVRVRVELDGLPVSLAEVAALRPGDVIALGVPVDRPLPLRVGRLVIGRVRPGAVGMRVAARVVASPEPGPGTGGGERESLREPQIQGG
jgi:flagellar motor switch protein FliM